MKILSGAILASALISPQSFAGEREQVEKVVNPFSEEQILGLGSREIETRQVSDISSDRIALARETMQRLSPSVLEEILSKVTGVAVQEIHEAGQLQKVVLVSPESVEQDLNLPENIEEEIKQIPAVHIPDIDTMIINVGQISSMTEGSDINYVNNVLMSSVHEWVHSLESMQGVSEQGRIDIILKEGLTEALADRMYDSLGVDRDSFSIYSETTQPFAEFLLACEQGPQISRAFVSGEKNKIPDLINEEFGREAWERIMAVDLGFPQNDAAVPFVPLLLLTNHDIDRAIEILNRIPEFGSHHRIFPIINEGRVTGLLIQQNLKIFY
ncbi:MAG: hypothetical protein V1898_00095 [Patescibacteria group bacterium]